jgi:hypothetical protein
MDCGGSNLSGTLTRDSSCRAMSMASRSMNKPDPSEYMRDGDIITEMHGKTVKRLVAAGMLYAGQPGQEQHWLTPKGLAWFALPKGKRFKWDDSVTIQAKEDPVGKKKTTGDYVKDSLNPSSPNYVPLGTYEDERQSIPAPAAGLETS